MTAVTGMTGKYNVLDIEDMDVILGDGVSADEDKESSDSGTCVSLFEK
jgi:hypothetical protein